MRSIWRYAIKVSRDSQRQQIITELAVEVAVPRNFKPLGLDPTAFETQFLMVEGDREEPDEEWLFLWRRDSETIPRPMQHMGSFFDQRFGTVYHLYGCPKAAWTVRDSDESRVEPTEPKETKTARKRPSYKEMFDEFEQAVGAVEDSRHYGADQIVRSMKVFKLDEMLKTALKMELCALHNQVVLPKEITQASTVFSSHIFGILNTYHPGRPGRTYWDEKQLSSPLKAYFGMLNDWADANMSKVMRSRTYYSLWDELKHSLVKWMGDYHHSVVFDFYSRSGTEERERAEAPKTDQNQG